MAKGYTGWILPEAERARLLGTIPTTHSRVFAHHVTHKFGVTDDEPLPSETTGLILGVADANGVQCLIVQIGDSSQRPDGSVYHITWSLADGRKPVDSNAIAKQWPFIADAVPAAQAIFYHPIEVSLEPKFFAF